MILRFVGRRNELESLRRLLAAHRVVTIVGPGGMGKTRLASEFAHLCAGDYEGVWRVPMAGLVELQTALIRLAEEMGVRLRSDQPAEDAVEAALADSNALVVLDEAESAPAVVPLVRALLACSPRLHALITSRAPITVAGERVVELGPLDEAEQLFIECVEAIRPGITIEASARKSISALCRRLGGVPLAIELAAAQVAHRAEPGAAAPLDKQLDVEHFRTLEGLLEWAYRSLPPDEMRFFTHLGIFPETFTVEAAQVVASGDARHDAATTIERLQSKALIKRATTAQARFFLHPVVREYAFERLHESGEAPRVQRAFSAYYGDLVTEMWAPHGDGFVDRIEKTVLEWPCLREVLHWTLEERADVDLGCRVVLALSEFWSQSGRHSEAWYWILSALEVAPPGEMREEMMFAAAVNAHGRGDFGELESLCRQLVAIYETRHDPGHLARSLNGVANARYRLGDTVEAEALYWRALEQHRLAGQRYGEATVLMNLGALKADRMLDFASARSYFLESLALFREFDVSTNVGTLLANLAEISSREGDHDRAIEYARKSRAVFQQLRNEGLAAWQLTNMAQFELERGQTGNAVRTLRQAQDAYAEGSMSHEHAAGYLETAFLIAADVGDHAWAAKLHGYTNHFRQLHRVARTPSESSLVEPRVQRALAALGEDAFARLCAEGATLDDAAVEEYLLRFVH
jgi:predicted ATPase